MEAMTRNNPALDDAIIGARLRQARLTCGLSLKAVESSSNGTLAAATVSVYERGERPISALRLFQLAELYGSAIEDLVGFEPERQTDRSEATGPLVRLDLKALEDPRGRDARVASGLVQSIQLRRNNKSSDSIAVRREDLATAAATVGKSFDAFVDSLRKAGLVRRSRGRPPKT
jgi:transcriptional regulator with XRE-family HTH domain